MSDENIIHATPQKDFFIDMLTRDIGLTESVLDLIDNSIHSLIRKYPVDVMPLIKGGKQHRLPQNATIDINFDSSNFSIYDTCGGITRQAARTSVFLFGRIKREHGNLGLGLYGVGMKRAFFKLGKYIEVTSKVKDDIFKITIDVDKWKNKPDDWTFNFDPNPPINTLKQDGTCIEITGLHPHVSKTFLSQSTEDAILKRVEEAYMLFIINGLTIKINGTTARSEFPAIAENFTPARKTLRVDGVNILIIAGLAPRESKTPHGWYVFCNGRMILHADQSDITGWGTERFPQFHNKFNHFIGQVYFSSTQLDKLPWDTTKSRIVADSPIYQSALNEMKIQARPIINTLNQFYPSEYEQEELIQKELLQDSKSISIDKISKRNTSFNVIRSSRTPPSEINISYRRPRAEVERVKQAMGNFRASTRKIGEHTFDYFLNKECEE